MKENYDYPNAQSNPGPTSYLWPGDNGPELNSRSNDWVFQTFSEVVKHYNKPVKFHYHLWSLPESQILELMNKCITNILTYPTEHRKAVQGVNLLLTISEVLKLKLLYMEMKLFELNTALMP